MNKAVFFDRDGVINEMVFDTETGTVHTPLRPDQVVLSYGISESLKATKQLGYLNVIISNQTNVGLGRITAKTHELIRTKINQELQKEDAVVDKEYYCFHHPFAKLEKYKKVCDCRKPNIALFSQAARDLNIDLKQSWMVGDGVFDVIAGHNAGCKTILVANINEAGYLKVFEEKLGNIKPNFVVKHISEIIPIISSHL